MHANVWIRKKNIEIWNRLKDKSDFINTILEDYADEPSEQAPEPRGTSADLEQKRLAKEQEMREAGWNIAGDANSLSDEEYGALDEAGLEYVKPGVAWSSERENNVPYKFINGKVVLG